MIFTKIMVLVTGIHHHITLRTLALPCWFKEINPRALRQALAHYKRGESSNILYNAIHQVRCQTLELDKPPQTLALAISKP